MENSNERIKGLAGKIEELESQLRAYWQEMKAELRELRKGRESSPPGGAVKGSPEELYKQGFDAFQKGSYSDAVQIFSNFAAQAPDAPLVPNAYYWMGEAYMNLKDYEKAILRFQEVVDKFPNSDKAARAMVRQAEAFQTLGDKKSSVTLLKRVTELFPKSEEARVAERMLRGGFQ
jgi:tol-pal system protein YbgF